MEEYTDIAKTLEKYNDDPIALIGGYIAENRFHEFLLTKRGFIIVIYSYVCCDYSDIWAYHITDLKNICVNNLDIYDLLKKENSIRKSLDEAYENYNNKSNKKEYNISPENLNLENINIGDLKFTSESREKDLFILRETSKMIGLINIILNCYKYNINIELKNVKLDKDFSEKDDNFKNNIIQLLNNTSKNNIIASYEVSDSIFEERAEFMISHIIISLYYLKFLDS